MLLLALSAAIIDFRTYRIPDLLTLPLIVLAAIFAPLPADDRILGLALAPLLLGLLRFFFHRVRGYHGLGFGDVKLSAACGALVGVGQVGLMLLGSALFALLVIFANEGCKLIRPGKPMSGFGGHAIAFGPYLILSTFTILLFLERGFLP